MRLRGLSSGEAARRRGGGHHLHRHRSAAGETRGGGVRGEGGRAGRDLRRAGRHLRPVLARRGLTYAPDYVINGGGLINVNAELHGWAPERARSTAREIYDTLLRVFEIAREEGIPSYRAADRLAEQRIAAIAKVRRNFV